MEKDSTTNEELIGMIKSGFDQVGKDIAAVNNKVDSVNNKVDMFRAELSSEIRAIGTEMRDGFDHIDDQFHQTNEKVDMLIEKLHFKKVITKEEAKEVMRLGPFPLS